MHVYFRSYVVYCRIEHHTLQSALHFVLTGDSVGGVFLAAVVDVDGDEVVRLHGISPDDRSTRRSLEHHGRGIVRRKLENVPSSAIMLCKKR